MLLRLFFFVQWPLIGSRIMVVVNATCTLIFWNVHLKCIVFTQLCTRWAVHCVICIVSMSSAHSKTRPVQCAVCSVQCISPICIFVNDIDFYYCFYCCSYTDFVTLFCTHTRHSFTISALACELGSFSLGKLCSLIEPMSLTEHMVGKISAKILYIDGSFNEHSPLILFYSF